MSPWRPSGSCLYSSAEALCSELHLLCGSAVSPSKDGGTPSTCCQQTQIKPQIKTATLNKKRKKVCAGSIPSLVELQAEAQRRLTLLSSLARFPRLIIIQINCSLACATFLLLQSKDVINLPKPMRA